MKRIAKNKGDGKTGGGPVKATGCYSSSGCSFIGHSDDNERLD